MKDQCILIVGGASGIGLATAELLHANGYTNVIVADRVSGPKFCQSIILDITEKTGYLHQLKAIQARLGGVDIAVISAAIHNACPVEFATDDMIDQVLDVNLIAHIKFVRDLIPFMNKGGRLLPVSSLSAVVGIPMEALYCASKAGLELFYESLQGELSYRGISVSIIQPGNVNTGFNEKGNDYRVQGVDYLDKTYGIILERTNSRLGMPVSDVAKAIVKAMEQKKPSLCYVVGPNALKANLAKRILGRDLCFKVMMSFFGIKTG